MFKQFLYKHQYQSILIRLVICLGMIRLKYNSFDTDTERHIMQSKKKANRKIEIFILVTSYPYIPLERSR